MRNRPKSDAQRHTDKTIAAAVGVVAGVTTGGGKVLGGTGSVGAPAMTFTTEGTDDDGNTYTIYPFMTELDSTETDGPVTS